VAIVWPCPLAVDAYAAARRDVGSRAQTARRVPGRRCSDRGVPASCPGRCARRGVRRALLPAFTLASRLDVAETIGRHGTQRRKFELYSGRLRLGNYGTDRRRRSRLW
jgi:hypothetical protein